MNWKLIENPIPQSVVQMIVVDARYRMLMMHRSSNVRSARNVWSFPSGCHEIGEHMEECGARELHEEYSLRAHPGRMVRLGSYENIAGDPEPGAAQYHWLINVIGAYVDDVTKAINNEPDKHDHMLFPPIGSIHEPWFFNQYPFHTTFSRWAMPIGFELQTKLTNLVVSCK